MGLFDLFKKEKGTISYKDFVWKSQQGKFTACIDFIKKFPDAIWIYWFRETEVNFKNFLQTQNASSVELKQAKMVFPQMVMNKTVIFLEHYPLPSAEEELMKFWEASTIQFCSSLDEALFQQFGGSQVTGIMDKLGMDDFEHLEHPMISKSIKQAQKKLQEKVKMDISANSQAEWFKINVNE